MRERRFQSRVTHTDIQRVWVIGDIQQILHTWLARTSAISKAQLAHLRETITEINIRGKIEDRPLHNSIKLRFLISQRSILRLQRDSYIKSIFFSDKIQPCIYIMIIIIILGIFTQILIPVILISQRKFVTKMPVPNLTFVSIRYQIIGASVAFTIFILEFITELQKSSFRYRFVISQFCRVIIVLRRRCGIPPVIIIRLSGHCVKIARQCLTKRLTIIITITECTTECNVTSQTVQPPVQLQRSISRKTLTLWHRFTVTRIYTDILQRVILTIPYHLIQKSIRIRHKVKRVLIKRSRFWNRIPIRFSIRKIRTENNVSQRIRFPFQTKIGIKVSILITTFTVRIRIGVAILQETFRIISRYSVSVTKIITGTTA